ncbi:MAG: zinc ribbon domain-containing protein [Segniliparus sp.]|uniref:zinc ribbon domain-containing protein n=1 Tax=Segniliparus sp. TaxID=2804064 RepID=UPI003F2A2451
MKADPKAQRELLDVVALDTQVRQLNHRLHAIPEAERLANAKAAARTAADEAAVVAMRIEDVDREIAKREGDVDAVRKREERDEQLLKSGALDSRVQNDVQHELGSLRKRQAVFEDELLVLMEQREQEFAALADAQTRRSAADEGAASASTALAEAEARLKEQLHEAAASREEHVSRVKEQPGGDDLLGLYERLRARGAAAGRLDGRRCGACRLELTAVEMSQISSSAPDDVARCPECEAILVRTGS